ncbi:AAA family ATPase [Bradyrhizobium betae]
MRFKEVAGMSLVSSQAITAALVDIDPTKRNLNLRFFSLPVLTNSTYGPVRLNPSHAYNLGPSHFDEKGLHAPDKLRKLYSVSANKNREAINRINQFGRESGMFDRLFVGLYKKSDPRAPFRIEIEKGGQRFSLDEVGYGVSQILPILVDSITTQRSDNALISIQQPELHLHPRAQAAFGALLFKLAKLGVRFLVETHSDYIIDRFRYEMFKDRQKTVTSGILFAENNKTGNFLHEIAVDPDGRISNSPPSYRRFFFREQDKLFAMI